MSTIPSGHDRGHGALEEGRPLPSPAEPTHEELGRALRHLVECVVALVGDREKAAAPALAPAEPLWTRPQAAEALRVSLRHLDALTSAGVIPVVRMGRATRIRPEDVRAFLERASRDSHRGGPSHGEA